MTATHHGHCLCGAVTVTVTGPLCEISGCHCDLCTRFGGGLQLGMDAAADDVRIEGPVKTHRSSRLAERAWCDTCGSPVYFRYVEGPDTGYLELSPGLFDDAGGSHLARVVYSDRAIGGIELAGDIERMTQAEYEATHANLNEKG